jgi:DNA-binding HxlR family transcriptional regulator
VALPNDYTGQACSLARSLEIIGERWTLLIVRDAFWGVRRFADFIDHLQLPRAVLASRLKTLVAAGVLTRVAGERHLEYELTGKGKALWPVVLSLMSWGDNFCAPGGRGGCSGTPPTAGRSTGGAGAMPAARRCPRPTPSLSRVPGSSRRRTATAGSPPR